VGPAGSLPCSEDSAIGPLPEPDESSPHPYTLFKIQINIPFATASRLALGPTQPPIKWVKPPRCETEHSPPSSAMELYLHSPNTPSRRGAQLKAQGQLYLTFRH